MKCDGRALNRTDYAILFSTIGILWGRGNEISTFNIPNLQGEFIRGVKSNRQVGSHETYATKLPNNAFKVSNTNTNHAHAYIDAYFAEVNGDKITDNNSKVGAGYRTDRDNNRFTTKETTGGVNQHAEHSHTISGGDEETRPSNYGVNYIIKVQ